MNKKTRNIIIIIAAVLVLGFIAYSVVDAQQTARRLEEAKQRKIDTVSEVLQPFAEKYGFSDMVCTTVYDDSLWITAVVEIPSFEQATDEEKLAFLADVAFSTEGIPCTPSDTLMSSISRHGLDLRVISGEYSYKESVSGKYSELRRASAEDAYSTSTYSPYKEELIAMETPHSTDVAESLAELITEQEKQEKEVCFRCNGTGKVVLHYGKRWHDEEGYIYGQKCGLCGGTGLPQK